MSEFIFIFVENRRDKDLVLLRQLVEERFGVGCQFKTDRSQFCVSGLDYALTEHTTLINIADTPTTDWAGHLTLQEDWAEDGNTDVPKKLDDRLQLICEVFQFVLSYFRLTEGVLVIADGGYVYGHSGEHIDKLFYCMKKDIYLDDFLGNAYSVNL